MTHQREDLLAILGKQSPAPGGVAVAALTVSMAAGLVVRAGAQDAAEARALERRAAALADDDDDVLTRGTDVALEIAEVAARIAQLAAEVVRIGRRDGQGDAATALLLAEGATRSAAYLVEVNVEADGGSRDLVALARAHIASARAARELAGGRAPVPAEH